MEENMLNRIFRKKKFYWNGKSFILKMFVKKIKAYKFLDVFCKKILCQIQTHF